MDIILNIQFNKISKHHCENLKQLCSSEAKETHERIVYPVHFMIVLISFQDLKSKIFSMMKDSNLYFSI